MNSFSVLFPLREAPCVSRGFIICPQYFSLNLPPFDYWPLIKQREHAKQVTEWGRLVRAACSGFSSSKRQHFLPCPLLCSTRLGPPQNGQSALYFCGARINLSPGKYFYRAAYSAKLFSSRLNRRSFHFASPFATRLPEASKREGGREERGSRISRLCGQELGTADIRLQKP